MKITFLGTGTSTGVPEVGCHCEVCNSCDPRDKRLRSSLLVEISKYRWLIDCGPDFRYQMLREKIDCLDAVLLTHEHYDHTGGLDDLRPFSYRKQYMDVYAEDAVAETIEKRIPYVFRDHPYPGVPRLRMQRISTSPFRLNGMEVIPIRLMHACLPILGFRIGDMAYLTDVKTIPDEELKKLSGLDLLIINALRFEEHLSHQTLDQALSYIKQIQPRQAYITHMSHKIGLHAESEKGLPPHVFFAYDGLTLTIS